MLGVEGVAGAGGEDDDGRGRAVAGSEGAQSVEELEREIDDAVVIGQGAIEVAGLLGHEAAILDGVAEADRGVGAGLDATPSFGGAHEVEAQKSGGIGALRVEAEARPAIERIGEHGLGWEDAGAEGLLAVVKIDEEGVDEAGALAKADLEDGPFLGGEDERRRLQFPEIIGGASGGVVRVREVGQARVADG